MGALKATDKKTPQTTRKNLRLSDDFVWSAEDLEDSGLNVVIQWISLISSDHLAAAEINR